MARLRDPVMHSLLSKRYALVIALTIYFAIHVVVRTLVSPTLGFDESEQAYLTQSIQWGYNSQPPLYTWLQAGLFSWFGCSAFSLALLKNLFLLATYFFVYEAIHTATKQKPLAAISALAMLLIPQIAWESHRDLSHTVAATCATTMLLYCIVNLADANQSQRYRIQLLWYFMTGVSIGIGMMFKYNFAIVTFGFLVGCASIPSLRKLIFDRRLVITVCTSAIILLPHALWVYDHQELASSKTIGTLTSNETSSWIVNVVTGSVALTGSIISCCLLLVVAITSNYFWKRNRVNDHRKGMTPMVDVGLLLERFLLSVVAVLFLLVLSGHALEFKNRWLQPFVCVLPAYLVLRHHSLIAIGKSDLRRMSRTAIAVMAIVLIATIVRPMVRSWQGRPSHLNIPYAHATRHIQAYTTEDPRLILACNTRVAGNLRVSYPRSQIVSLDALSSLPIDFTLESGQQVLAFCDNQAGHERDQLRQLAERLLNQSLSTSAWQNFESPYIHGFNSDQKQFQFRLLDAQVKTASLPSSIR